VHQGKGLLWIILVAAVGCSAVAHEWWQRAEERASAAHPPAGSSVQRSQAEERLALPAASEQPGSVRQAETTSVVRCVIDGHVTYSQIGDCRGTQATIPIRAGRGEVEGGFSAYELEMLRSADARVARDEAMAEAGSTSQTFVISNKQSECSGLDRQIQALDARARNPISGHEQDLIRDDRTRVRSRQFSLHC